MCLFPEQSQRPIYVACWHGLVVDEGLSLVQSQKRATFVFFAVKKTLVELQIALHDGVYPFLFADASVPINQNIDIER